MATQPALVNSAFADVQARLERRRHRGTSSDDDPMSLVHLDAWLVVRDSSYGAYPYAAELPVIPLRLDSSAPMGRAIESDDVDDHLSHDISSILKNNSPDGTLHWTTMSRVQRIVRHLDLRPCLSIKLKDGKGSDLENIACLIHERVASIVDPVDKKSLGVDFMIEIYRPQFLSSSVIYPLSLTEVEGQAAEKLRDKIFEVTRKEIKDALLGVGLYKMHPEGTGTSEEPIPTAGVMVRRKVAARNVVGNWDSLVITLEGEAARVGNLRVRLIEAGVEERVSYADGLYRPRESLP